MIMYRHGIPLVPAEEIGYHLGLTVRPDEAHLFYNVRSSDEPPTEAGYGTQIFNPEFEPNKAFAHLNIPLTFSVLHVKDIADEHELFRLLTEIEENDRDVLLCFNYGTMIGEFRPGSGHVVVFDTIIDGEVRILDTVTKQPKWRTVEPARLYDAMQQHGDSGSIWYFDHT